MENILNTYREVFQKPKVIPPKMEVEHEIKLFPESPSSNNGLYKEFVLEVEGVNNQLQQMLEQGIFNQAPHLMGHLSS